MKRDCPNLGNKEATSQLLVGQRERTQPTNSPQSMAARDRTGAQAQVSLSTGPQQGGQLGRPRTVTRVYAITQQEA